FRLVDRALVDEVAARAGVAPADVASLEERTPGFLERFLQASAAERPDVFVPAAGAVDPSEEARPRRAPPAPRRDARARGGGGGRGPGGVGGSGAGARGRSSHASPAPCTRAWWRPAPSGWPSW